jgi:hypothetical protein
VISALPMPRTIATMAARKTYCSTMFQVRSIFSVSGREMPVDEICGD